MDCEHILDNDLHERYILDRLEESDLAEYEKHIGRCDSCRVELEKQRHLIAALRDIGREEMKEEIRRQVADRTPARAGINWMKLSKIAAVIALFVVTPTIVYHLQKEEQRLETARLQKVPGEVPTEEIESSRGDIGRATPDPSELTIPPVTSGARETSQPDARHEAKTRLSKEIEESRILTYRYEGRARDIETGRYLGVPTEGSETAKRGGESMVHSLTFVSNGKSIVMNFTGALEEQTETLPVAFAVEVVTKGSSHMEISAEAGSGVYGIISQKARIELLPDETMHIVLNDSTTYLIDLQSENPRAIMEQ